MGIAEFLASITEAVKTMSTSTLRTVITSTLAVTVALAIAWFGYRFVIRKVQKALHKGSL